DTPEGNLTFRQVLERHRREPACAGCHSKIDPIGFGLENFDPIGRWRTTLHGRPVDSIGKLPDGTVFNGPGDLKRTILSRTDEFTRNVTEKMLAYALGRGLEFHDRKSVQQIAEAVTTDNHKTRTLIHQITRSYPFTHRRP
ncbi:MAG: DUF1585 domain-containing protein, partial [Verrucomicrobiales bacterium]|nr:DUF1585 domain-containing protein [Verrucomicrobiales bacterium]